MAVRHLGWRNQERRGATLGWVKVLVGPVPDLHDVGKGLELSRGLFDHLQVRLLLCGVGASKIMGNAPGNISGVEPSAEFCCSVITHLFSKRIRQFFGVFAQLGALCMPLPACAY